MPLADPYPRPGANAVRACNSASPLSLRSNRLSALPRRRASHALPTRNLGRDPGNSVSGATKRP